MRVKYLIIFLFSISLYAEPKIGDVVEVDNYDGSGNNASYTGTFKINKIDADGYYYGSWVKVPAYFKSEGKKPTNYTSCDYMIQCRKEKDAEGETFSKRQAELNEELKPDEYFKKVLNNELFGIQNELTPGEVVEICYIYDAECNSESYSKAFLPAKVIKKNGSGYDVNLRVFDSSIVGSKVGFTDRKITVHSDNIKQIKPELAPGSELTDDMITYEVIRPGTLIDTKFNGKWYRALITSKLGNGGMVEIVYINWGTAKGVLGIKNPIYEHAPYGSKTKTDTGAYSGLPYPWDSRGASVIDVSKFKKNTKCPPTMPFVSGGICVDENGQWKGARPVRP